MAYRKLKNIKGKILAKALEIGANEGVYNITARKIAKNCDISTHTIYNYFQSMRELIDSIAFNYDRKYMEDIKKVILKGYSKQEIFYHFLDIYELYVLILQYLFHVQSLFSLYLILNYYL